MKSKIALLATTALVALALSAPAAEAAGSGWYVSLSGGANWLNENDLFSSNGVDTVTLNTESDTGFFVGGAVGYSLGNLVTPGLRVEVEVGYRDNQVDGDWSSTTGVGSSGLIEYDHTSTSVLANVWYDFDVGGFRPYVGGGIGWADVEVDGTYIGAADPTIDASDDGFAWQIGGGINFQVSPNVQLGLGYRYFSGPEVTILAPDLPANTLTPELDYENHTAMATLTFGM